MPSLKILILRFSSMGDIVLTSPVIRCLKAKFGDKVSIQYLCKSSFKVLLEGNPHLDKIWTFENHPTEVLIDLKAEKFDLIIDLQRNFKSKSLIRSMGIRSHRLKKLNVKKWILVNLGLDLLPSRHIVERYMDTIQELDVELDTKGLDYFIPESVRSANAFPIPVPSKYVLFALGGAHLGKRMTATQWSEIGIHLDKEIVLIGGKEDSSEAEAISTAIGKPAYNLCGKLSIHQSALLAEKAGAVLTGDTGMMHIASAFKAKIVSVWGCTVPKFGMYPFRPNPKSVILEPTQLKRRPCSKLGNRCKYGMNNRCITHLDNREIADAVLKLLEE